MEILPPEIEHAWRKSPEYTVLNLVFLATWTAPISFEEFIRNPEPLHQNYLRSLRDMLFEDNPQFKNYVNGQPPGSKDEALCSEPIPRDKAVELLDRLVGTPNFFTDKNEPSTLGCIDLNHPLITKEFKIALEAWDAVLKSNPPRPKKGSRKTLIIDWLRRQNKEQDLKLSNDAIKRIAVLLNPDKDGGAPPT